MIADKGLSDFMTLLIRPDGDVGVRKVQIVMLQKMQSHPLSPLSLDLIVRSNLTLKKRPLGIHISAFKNPPFFPVTPYTDIYDIADFQISHQFFA